MRGPSPIQSPSPLARRFVAWTLRNGWALWLAALLVGVPAAIRTATLYLHLNSDFEQLLPRDSPSVRAVQELRERMPGLQYLGVIVDTGSADRLGAGEALLDDLAARVRAYPPELARSVRTGVRKERDFIEQHAPLYYDLNDLRTLRSRIEDRRDWDIAKMAGESPEGREPPVDFGEFVKRQKQRLGGEGNTKLEDGRWSSREQHATLLLIEAGEFSTGTGGRQLLERVQHDIADLGGTGRYAPGMSVGFTGDVAIAVEELTALVQDISISTAVVVLAVGGVIVFYYRWWRSLVILVVPLMLATVYAFALASLPPLGITELNSNTAFLGAIIVGNGINFAIILLARYVEERRRGLPTQEALVIAVSGARVGTLSAALAASVSYASLITTDFRGFRQFGVVGGLGMLLAWLVAFVLMPPLTAWLDRSPATAPSPLRRSGGIMGPLARATDRFALPLVLVGCALTAGAVWTVRGFGADRLETDMARLRRADTWTKGEGYWGQKADELIGEYVTPTVMLCEDPEQARAVAAAVRQALDRPPLEGFVRAVRTQDDVVPPDQAAKLHEVELVREDLPPKLRSLIPRKQLAPLERLLGPPGLRPVTARDLPPTLTTALREKDGTFGRSVLVYPHRSHALWEGPPLIAAVSKLRALGATESGGAVRPARVAGALPVSADILSYLQHDAPRSTIIAFLGVLAVVAILFRWHRTTLLVVGSLLVAVLWVFAGTMLLGIKINFSNAIAFPITFGIGVDYAVNVVSRYLQDGGRDAPAAVRSTGGAVILSSMTTMLGYTSLVLAKNRALHLFGLVAVMGELACVTTAVVMLPALLVVLQRRRSRRMSSGGATSA
jgi:predicted RND superfamily exporter protein